MVIPQSLKLGQLKTLCHLCGISKTGTKETLRRRLTLSNAARAHGANPLHNQRVLSIDLGVRNLAFALLQAEPRSPDSRTTPRAPPRAVISEWDRLVLAEPIDSHINDVEPYEIWSPASMSRIAIGLVMDRILLMKPTVVVLERQRYRSANQAAVLEWTLRVNTLEAMIWAALRTLQEIKLWGGELYSMPPARVSAYWVTGNLTPEDKAGARVKTVIKKAKIDVAGGWLLDRDDVFARMDGDAIMTAQAFLKRWQKQRRKKADGPLGDNEIEFDKLDDLADCLLQGMAWIRWEHNKQCIADGRAEDLLKEFYAVP